MFDKYGPKKIEAPKVSDYKLQEQEAMKKRLKNQSYKLVVEDDDSSHSEGEEDINPQQLKFFQDLEKIKNQQAQIEQIKEQTKNASESDGLNKREDKELKKLMKEKDKLERDAMVARMLEKDKE